MVEYYKEARIVNDIIAWKRLTQFDEWGKPKPWKLKKRKREGKQLHLWFEVPPGITMQDIVDMDAPTEISGPLSYYFSDLVHLERDGSNLHIIIPQH